MRPKIIRVYFDECMSVKIASSVSNILHGFQIRTPSDEGLREEKDLPLFDALKSRNFHVFVTADKAQHFNEQEYSALVDSGLHWIGVNKGEIGRRRSPKGLELAVSETSAITWTLLDIAANWDERRFAHFIGPSTKPNGYLLGKKIL